MDGHSRMHSSQMVRRFRSRRRARLFGKAHHTRRSPPELSIHGGPGNTAATDKKPTRLTGGHIVIALTLSCALNRREIAALEKSPRSG